MSNTGQYQLAIPAPYAGYGFFISTNFGGDWTRVYDSILYGSFSTTWQNVLENTTFISSSGQRLVCFSNSNDKAYISSSPSAQIAWVLDTSNNIVNNYLYRSVGIGQIAGAGYTLDVSGNANITGSHYASTYNSQSDYRIKENVTSLDDTFIVDNLKPVTYTNTKTDKQDVGFIAHELQEVYPFLVNGTKDGEQFQSINYTGLIGILTKEIQDLKERVTTLEEK
jgi:hypothetical protein